MTFSGLIYKISFIILPLLFQTAWCQNFKNSDFLNAYDIKFYFLDLKINNSSINLEGNVKILAEMVNPDMDSIAVELIQEVTLDSAWLDGDKTNFSHSNDLVRIAIPPDFEKGEIFQMTFFYKLKDIDTDERIGIFNRHYNDQFLVTYTLSEPYFSKSWFPCKQVLSDKADSVYIFLTMADSLMAGASGLLTNISYLENGEKRYEWKSYYPVAYYLLSFAVANYMDYSFMASTADGDSVLIQNYIYNDSLYFWENKDDIDATSGLMELFSECFGPYPFRDEKYGHCIGPLGGGMEHQTMTTLGNFSFILVAHELAHQWFGNYVTCADWQNIWINEGFASYAEFIAIEKFKSKNDVVSWLNDAHSRAMSSPNGSIFVPEDMLDNVTRIFDYSLTYRKGASVIHMLRHEMGNDELFFGLLNHFLDKYSDSVATAEDFRITLEQYTNRNFETFFQQWFYGAGHPILDIAWEQRNDSVIIYLDQTVSTASITPFFNLLIDFKLEYIEGDTLIQFRQEFPSEVFKFPLDKKVYRITPDPDDWLLREIKGVNRIIREDNKFFQLFPNPADDTVFIENYNIGKPFNVKIYNMNGVLLKEADEKQVFATIHISDLTSGIYKVIVSTEGHTEIFQLAKL